MRAVARYASFFSSEFVMEENTRSRAVLAWLEKHRRIEFARCRADLFRENLAGSVFRRAHPTGSERKPNNRLALRITHPYGLAAVPQILVDFEIQFLCCIAR